MKLLRKLSILMAGGVFLLPSCEDPLEENPKGSIPVGNFYKSAEEIQLAVNGAYEDIWTVYLYKDHINVTSNDKPTDIIRGSSRNNNLTSWDVWSWNSTTSIFDNHWGGMYEPINKANYIIDAFEQWRNGEKEIDITESQANQLEGEARFIRAFWYFSLVKQFGGVPIHDEPTKSAEGLDKPRSTEEESWTFIEEELNKVVDLMQPYDPANQQMNRASVAAAQGFLARAHAIQNEWDAAKSYAQDALSHEYVQLMDDYKLIWHPDHEGSGEHIWSSNKVTGGSTTSSSNNNVWWYSVKGYNWEQEDGSIITIDFATNEDLKGHNQWVSDEFYYDTPNTYRKRQTMRDWMPYYIIKETDEVVHDTVHFPDNVSPMFVKHHVLKDDYSQYTSVNETIMRTSELYLLLAEAENELNGPTETAVDAINAVRGRARGDNLPDVQTPKSVLPDIETSISQTAFRDTVITEFAREFICEGLFRNVLRRHGMYAENQSKWVDDEAKEWANHKGVYPIPSHQMELNPNLDQNPGYSSPDESG